LTQAYALLAPAGIHYQVWDGRAAEGYLFRALPLLETLDETNLLVRVWIDLANAHWRLGDYDRAEEDCARAQAYLPRSGNLRLQAMVVTMQGTLRNERGCFAESLDYLARAERLYGSLGEGQELANVTEYGGIILGLKQWGRLSSTGSVRCISGVSWNKSGARPRYSIIWRTCVCAYRGGRRSGRARACVAQRRHAGLPWAQKMLARIAELEGSCGNARFGFATTRVSLILKPAGVFGIALLAAGCWSDGAPNQCHRDQPFSACAALAARASAPPANGTAVVTQRLAAGSMAGARWGT
jgi:tetratricopeptide (TPR) repeat protein